MSLRWLAPIALAFLVTVGCHEVHLDYDGRPGEIDVYDDLFSVSVIDEDHVIAVGYFGAIYTTDDGGASWTKRDSGTPNRRATRGASDRPPHPESGPDSRAAASIASSSQGGPGSTMTRAPPAAVRAAPGAVPIGGSTLAPRGSAACLRAAADLAACDAGTRSLRRDTSASASSC